MKNNTRILKPHILRFLPLMILVFALSLSGTGIISAFAALVYPENANSFVSEAYEYSWTDDEDEVHDEEVTFDCYPISSGYSGEHPGVAVAWHDETEDPLTHNTPDQLEIPTTLVDANDAVYDVVAIYKAGFRYCDFSKVSIPNTVQEIGEEAFAYCLNLTEFSLPFACRVISPSMLMDCRNLETFSYRDSEGADTTDNLLVTTVGDHAFANCLKLKGFTCPTSLVKIGDSAFQNCQSIVSLFFPKTTYASAAAVPSANRIIVGNYAFAECIALTMVFFDVNLWSFGEYCFAKCNLMKLTLNYTGSAESFEDPSVMQDVDPHWRDRYTALGNLEKFNFVGSRGKLDFDKTKAYPGLYFTIDDDYRTLTLDQSTRQDWQARIFRVLGNNSLNGTTEYYIDRNDASDFTFSNDTGPTTKYATIIQFIPPESTDFPAGTSNPYYSNGALRIPDTVTAEDGNEYPVRVIDSNVFKDHAELTSLKFGYHLMQIRHHAFLGCTNITSIDFTQCHDLIEVSYEVFHVGSGDNEASYQAYKLTNPNVTSLRLPNCLKYIGPAAFCGFTKVNDFHLSLSTVFIAESAFEDLGKDIDGVGTVDMVLPNTLRDGPVDQAPKGGYGFKIYRYSSNNVWDETIQQKAFKGAKCLRSVKMQDIPEDSGLMTKVNSIINNGQALDKRHDALSPYRMGLQINAFENCTSLVRFEANQMLYTIGKDSFKGCTALKEMFLTTFGSKVIKFNNGCPWGFDGNGIAANKESSIFGTNTVFTDLVVYIDDPNGAPHGNESQANGTKWNAVAATYPNEFSTSSIALVPYYSGITRDHVKYYDLSSNAATTPIIDSTNFTSPSVAFIEKDTNDDDVMDEYIITRCYCGGADISIVDMSKFSNASLISTIGSGSFGQMDGYLPGRTIVLPSSVTTIEDRAFYRACGSATNNRGVQIITYKDNGIIQEDEDYDYYCILPPSVTSVGRLAFYNNCFKSISVKGDLSYLGNTAFGIYPYYDSNEDSNNSTRNGVASVSLGATENTFSVSATNGGLYYKEAGHKTLVYQPGSFVDNDNETDDKELRIDSDALAVGARACANTNYSSIKFPNSVTTLYGGAFACNLALSSVSFGNNPGLKYISAKAQDNDNNSPAVADVWNGSNCDSASTMNDVPGSTAINFEDYYGAFANNKALTDFDFTQLKSCLVKIGYGAFENCSALANMVGTQKYSYYKWTGTSDAMNNSDSLPSQPEKVDKQGEFSNKILDLSECSKLRSIGLKAFKNCTSIKYIHLPDNYDTASGKALYLGSGEPESGRTINQSKDESVFAGLTGAKIFVGEKSLTANRAHVADNQSRYPQKTFDSNKRALYRAESESDLWTQGEASYWHQLPDDNGTKRFVWFEKKANAISFFRSDYFASL